MWLTYLLTSLRKGCFSRRRLRRYRLLMAEIAVSMVFEIRLQASSRISIRNRLCMMDGYKCRSIKLAFFTEMSPLRTSVSL